MRIAEIGFLVLLGAHLMLPAAGVATQQDSGMAWVDLPQSKGLPDGQATVHVSLTLSRGVEVGSVSMTIRLPVKLLTFQALALRESAETAGVQARFKEEEEGPDSAVVRLTLEMPEKDGSRGTLPQGPLATMQFKIAKAAEPRTVIPLAIVEARAAGTTASPGAVKIHARDGRILVSHPLATACFFYMH